MHSHHAVWPSHTESSPGIADRALRLTEALFGDTVSGNAMALHPRRQTQKGGSPDFSQGGTGRTMFWRNLKLY